jgi:dGTPase
MDLADDIAYSTYDLEDTFKAGFLGPLDLLAASELYDVVAEKVARSTDTDVTAQDVAEVLLDLFGELAAEVDSKLDFSRKNASLASATAVYKAAARLTRDGYLRSSFTSRLIRLAIEGIELDFDEKRPALSKVRLTHESKRRVEVLKHFTFEATIQSNRVTISQFRAKEILHTIFDALMTDQRLLPEDARQLYRRVESDERARAICDFIAGMTDRYAVEFYGRIRSENPQTIFKPL